MPADPVRVGLWERLSADAELGAMVSGIHFRLAPQNAAYPVLVFDRQSRTAYWSFRTAADNDMWLVKAIAMADPLKAEEASQRADAVLDGAELEMPGKRSLYCRRDHGSFFYEEHDGHIFHHHGTVYRIWSEAA